MTRDVTPRFKTPQPMEPKARRRLRQRGAKTRRESQALIRARREIQERSAGLCEARKLGICGARVQHLGAHAHHVHPEDRDRGVHDPKRMLWLCPQAHAYAHNNPAKAKDLGLLRPEETP